MKLNYCKSIDYGTLSDIEVIMIGDYYGGYCIGIARSKENGSVISTIKIPRSGGLGEYSEQFNKEGNKRFCEWFYKHIGKSLDYKMIETRRIDY